MGVLEPPPRKHGTKSSYCILASSCNLIYYCWFWIPSTADYCSLESVVIMPWHMTAVSERRPVIPLTSSRNIRVRNDASKIIFSERKEKTSNVSLAGCSGGGYKTFRLGLRKCHTTEISVNQWTENISAYSFQYLLSA